MECVGTKNQKTVSVDKLCRVYITLTKKNSGTLKYVFHFLPCNLYLCKAVVSIKKKFFSLIAHMLSSKSDLGFRIFYKKIL